MLGTNYNNGTIPPIVAFGTKETTNVDYSTESYDYTTQTTTFPMFCGSNKKCTRSAKNVGSFLFPKWKSETDDAVEK